MNRRMQLNLMIFGLVTFLLVFSLVNRKFMDGQEEAQSVWDEPVLVPSSWQLTRLEMQDAILRLEAGVWISTQSEDSADDLGRLARAWQALPPESVTAGVELPEEGITILAFIREDSQPLVFRVFMIAESVVFYRMIDQRQFTFKLQQAEQLLLKEL